MDEPKSSCGCDRNAHRGGSTQGGSCGDVSGAGRPCGLFNVFVSHRSVGKFDDARKSRSSGVAGEAQSLHVPDCSSFCKDTAPTFSSDAIEGSSAGKGAAKTYRHRPHQARGRAKHLESSRGIHGARGLWSGDLLAEVSRIPSGEARERELFGRRAKAIPERWELGCPHWMDPRRAIPANGMRGYQPITQKLVPQAARNQKLRPVS